MDDPANTVTLWEAIKFIGPLIGTGGATAIIVAWFGTRRPKTEGPPPLPPQMGISALLSDSSSVNRLSDELRRLTDAVEEVGRAGNRVCDMLDIAAAVERLRHTDR